MTLLLIQLMSNVTAVYELIDGGRTLALNYTAVVGFKNLFQDSVTNYTIKDIVSFIRMGKPTHQN